jgi:hypothetical protein
MRLEFGAKFAIVRPKEMRNINRRESPRIEIKLRCHVTSPALWMRSAMYTENISRSGLLTVEVELPANHGFGQKCIHCQGTVIRILSDPECPRVALRVNYMDFRAFHDRLRVVDSMTPVVNSWMA